MNPGCFSLIFLVAVLGVLLSSCSTVIPPANLVPESYQVTKRHPASVRVEVESGQVEAGGYAHFTGHGFAEALAQALRDSGVFREASTTGAGTYNLTGAMSVEYDPYGFNLTTKTRSHWSLVRAGDGREVWSDMFATTHTATVGDAFVGTKRGRIATEEAAKKCIQEVVASLSRANL